MNKSTIKALGITQKEIDALDVILKSSIPGASLAITHLLATLGVLESAVAADPSTQKSNPPDDSGKKRKASGLDSLGGGNIL